MKKSKFVAAFSRYGIVAGGSAAADWAIFVALTVAGFSHLPSQMVARIAGGVFSFFANKTWTFDARSHGHLTVQGRRFLLLYAFSYVLAVGILYLMVDILDVTPYVGKAVSDVSCFIVNFVIMRGYVFHTREGFMRVFRRFFRVDRKNGDAEYQPPVGDEETDRLENTEARLRGRS